MATARSTVITIVSMALALLMITAGCAPAPEKKPDPQARFDSIVASADAAWKADDASTAFELYTKALATKDATDVAGVVAAKQDKAKRLTLAREILAGHEPALNSISPYVQVLLYSAVESTEAAAARNGLVDSLDAFPGQIKDEVNALRLDIKTGKSVELPTVVFVVNRLADGWESEVSQAPGSTGKHAAAAAAHLKAATDLVKKAFDRKYGDDALKDLAAADERLDAAARELEAARSEK